MHLRPTQFDGRADAPVRCHLHRPMEGVQGFTRSHWTPAHYLGLNQAEKAVATNECISMIRPSSTAELMRQYDTAHITQWRQFMATPEATGRRHWASICTVLPRRTTGFACRQKNDEKTSYLPAISLAVAVRRYDTKRITR